MVTKANYQIPNLEVRRRNIERQEMNIEVGGIENRTEDHNILRYTIPGSASSVDERAQRENLSTPARYIRPEAPTEESFSRQQPKRIRLPAIRRDITVTELDRLANRKCLESLISNKFHRDLLKDL